jgi:tetratricopeptide (TPR) repeat protein
LDLAIEHAPPLTEHFRGRHAEVNRGLTLLAERRLVSIHGMPGIGKTALSLAIGSIALGRGAFDRAVWHPLDGVRTVGILAARLAQDAHAQDMDAATIARAMGRDRSWLVVLDNAEDLIDADRAGLQHFLDALLREHERLRLLLTTRRRLGDLPMAREALLSVGRLEPPHDLILFQATAGERLMSAARDGDEVRELVELLDGHPQSIVLVASQVDLLPLSIIRHRLERDDVAAVVAAELIGNHDIGDRAAAKRAQRLLASLDLSYLPLASRHPAAAEMFAWLGALPAGLPAVLAPRVFSEDADEHLAVLLQYNLVEQRGPDRRLGMPAPLRWYATRHIAELTEDRQHALLNSTTLALADWVSAMKSQVGTSAARHAFDRALAEQPNLASLMEYITTASDPTLTIRWSHTVGQWSLVMQHAGRTTAAIPVVEQANAMQPPGSEGDAYTRKALGNLYARTDRLKEAEPSYLDALSIYRQIKNHLGEANIREALGDLYVRTDRLKEAEQSYLDALPIYRQIEDRLGVADTLLALGDLYVRTDRLKEAEQSYLDALPIYRQIEDRLGVASTLRAMGDFYVCTHKLKDAEQSYLDALPIFRQIEGRLGEAHTLLALGNLYVRSHRLKDAEQSYLQALPIFPQIEARGGEADTLLALGNLYIRSARWKRAEQSYLDALPIYRQIEKRLGEANTRKAMGDLYVLTARLENAEQSYLDALPIYLQIGDRLGEANTLRALGDLYVRTDRLTDAEQRYLDALSIYHRLEARLGQANTLRALGDLYVRIDRLKEAEQRYLDALPIYHQIQEHLGEANTLLALGDLYVRTDRLKDAEQNYLDALPIYHQIEDRLGEANTRQSIGNLALAQGLVVQAFAHYRQALALHEAIGDKVGVAADHGYLARAAQAAGALERAVVLERRPV